MESPKVLDRTEEQNSSESGWTTYIVSSFHEKNYFDDDGHRASKNRDDDDIESDDSMASDASSGPSNPELPFRSGKRGNDAFGHSKDSQGKSGSDYSSRQTTYEHSDKKKRNGIRMNAEKEVPEPKEDGGAKVRKTNKMEKK